MTEPSRNLVVLGCSSTKLNVSGSLPAISMYDGPAFRVLRAFLRERRWPASLSVAVLSAKHGLIGALAPITHYDLRMTSARASELHTGVTRDLSILAKNHARLDLVLGKTYLQSIDLAGFPDEASIQVVSGPIGEKLSRLHGLLRSLGAQPRRTAAMPNRRARPLYFLPDWDDFLDANYNFRRDTFSSPKRADRLEEHSVTLMRPDRMCDGILVSLAQNLGSKGLLRRVDNLESDALRARSVREHFALGANQWAFGDCGAFSYVSADEPTISVPQAVSLYCLYDFDFGASVDHIPLCEVRTDKGARQLSKLERERRVRLTRDNASRFLDEHRAQRATFVPVGIIQGLTSDNYGKQLAEYEEMGYEYVAIGGLVPRADAEILEIVETVSMAARKIRRPPAVHLLGVFRPQLQKRFQQLGIASFDSATYFRKAWLRSSQNYMGTDGNWYSAIRVPPSRDSRTLKRLKESGASEGRIKRLEKAALRALHAYDKGRIGLESCLQAVVDYDSLLRRSDETEGSVSAYRKVLTQKPWKSCKCRMCSSLGIDVVIFRGLNRNKRRGAHNTLQLYRRIGLLDSEEC